MLQGFCNICAFSLPTYLPDYLIPPIFLAHFVQKFSVLLLLLKFFFDSLWFTEEFLLSSHHYECFGALNNFLRETFRLQCWCLLYCRRASWLAVVARCELTFLFSFFLTEIILKKEKWFFFFFNWLMPILLQMLIVLVDWHINQFWRIYLVYLKTQLIRGTITTRGIVAT